MIQTMNTGWTEERLKAHREAILKGFGEKELKQLAESSKKPSEAESTNQESSASSPKETQSSKR